MLGYIVLKAKEDMYIKETNSHFIFRKNELYVAKYDYNNIKVFDERDNACLFGYFKSCMRAIPHYSISFEWVAFKSAINGKEFYKIRQQLRQKINK